MGKFTVISEDAFDALQLDAGVLLSNFDPANPLKPASEDIIATTTGGINPTCNATYSDFGEDVDNVPNNMKEFKHLDGWECAMAFTTIKFNAENTVWALGAADVADGVGYKKIVPRRNLKQTDFKDIWWVGDKANGGAYAIRLMNALSTGGLSIQSTKNGKGTNGLTITGHVSINDQDAMPMEFYDIDAPAFANVTVAAEAPTTEMWGYHVSDLQSDVVVLGGKITGTLKYIDEGSLATEWGAGNFMALKFADIDPKATSVKVGLDPSQSSGLVEIINDPDKNGSFKVTDKDAQVFKVVISDGADTVTQIYDLSELVLLDAGV